MATGSLKLQKSAPNSGAFTTGHDPRRGHGPAPGTGGRPAAAVRELCREIVDRYKLVDKLGELADSPAYEPRDRIAAAKLLMSYAFGAPTQVVEHSGVEGDDIQFTVKIHGAVDPL